MNADNTDNPFADAAEPERELESYDTLLAYWDSLIVKWGVVDSIVPKLFEQKARAQFIIGLDGTGVQYEILENGDLIVAGVMLFVLPSNQEVRW